MTNGSFHYDTTALGETVVGQNALKQPVVQNSQQGTNCCGFLVEMCGFVSLLSTPYSTTGNVKSKLDAHFFCQVSGFHQSILVALHFIVFF
jgi:hypothetical protein